MPALPLLPPEIAAQLTTGADLADRERGNRRPATLPTRVPALDRLLGGGLPRGSLVEVCRVGGGAPPHPPGAYRRASVSSGLFSAALSALAAVTQSGEAAALVDPGDHFDPQGAADAGVDLPRLLWLRPRGLKTALSACETVLSTGFALVVLDLGLARVSRRRFDDAVWLRLARRARFHETALFVLSPYRVTGTAAHVVLSAGAVRAAWDAQRITAAMPLLTGLESRLSLDKSREKGDARVRETHAPLRVTLLDAINAGRTEENEKKKIFLEGEEGKVAATGQVAASY